MEYRLRRHDGVYRWLFDRGVPFVDAAGEFAGYIGSCTDITEKVEAQQALAAQQRQELDRLATMVPVCSWCQRIRMDDGYWKRLEAYVQSQHLGTVTHGICDDCYAGNQRQRPGGL